MGILFILFGVSDVTVRVLGAACGVMTCWGVYRLGRALGCERAALMGAALLAVSLWHLILSRSGFRAVLFPMLLVHSMALLVEGLRSRSMTRMAAAGVFLGLGVHVYPAIRLAPLILPLYLLAELGWDRGKWRCSLRHVPLAQEWRRQWFFL